MVHFAKVTNGLDKDNTPIKGWNIIPFLILGKNIKNAKKPYRDYGK